MVDSTQFYDAIIIGGGPAGLSSAIYMARAKYKTLVLEKEKFGGQITITEKVVNYPGVFETSGEELTKEMQKQAQHFGAEFLLSEAKSFSTQNGFYEVKTDRGSFLTLGIIIATGASPRMIGFEGEEQFKGRGVAYCATCDGEFFAGKEIVVIGSGFAACEEAIFLTRFATKVHILMITDDFTCTGNVVDEVKAHEKIEIYYNAFIQRVEGNDFVQKAVFTQQNKEIIFEDSRGIGVFVFAGYVPASEKFANIISCNPQNYIITDHNQKTNMAGVYAAGDICIKDLRQVVTAVSDGASAATSLEKYIADCYEKMNLPKREYHVVEKEVVQESNSTNDTFISNEIRNELQGVFARFENSLTLKYKLDTREISKEVFSFVQEFSTLHEKIKCMEDESLQTDLPCISIYGEDNTYKGVSFHGVPGGHEFNSFIIGLYNAQGKGQAIAQEDANRIMAIQKPVHMKIALTLSCTNCPDLVIAAQKIAVMNPAITLDMYDLSQFEQLKQTFNIMSVPCLIINDTHVHFGKKKITEILDIIEKI